MNPAPQDAFVGGSQELQSKGVKTCKHLGVFFIIIICEGTREVILIFFVVCEFKNIVKGDKIVLVL